MSNPFLVYCGRSRGRVGLGTDSAFDVSVGHCSFSRAESVLPDTPKRDSEHCLALRVEKGRVGSPNSELASSFESVEDA